MKPFLPYLFILFSITAYAQVDTSKQGYEFVDPEIHPQFPAGDIALLKFIRANTVYPKVQADDTLKEHRVMIQFTITEQGKIIDIKVVKSAGKPFDDEALRVISLLPDFIPGRQGGKPVSVKYRLPFRFD